MKMGEETRRSRFTKLLPFIFLAICAARTRALSQDEGLQANAERNNAARVQRDLDGVTTVLLVSARPGKEPPPLGLLTKTARTFVQDGASTEYATQVLGTTLANGRLYARILATSSRVFYNRDSAAPDSSSPDPYIVYPSKVSQDNWQFGIALDNAVANAPPSNPSKTFTSAKDAPKDLPPALDEFLERENDVFAKSEPNPVSSVKFRPAKARSADDLPTYTVKNDAIYVPETSFTKDPPAPRSFTPRTPKAFGLQSRLDLRKSSESKPSALEKRPTPKPFETVTYYGFADFTTTVGDTVIVFSPSTAPAPVGRPATTIKGDATLRPGDGVAKDIQATEVVVGRWKTDSPAQPGGSEPSGDPLLDAVNGVARGPELQPSDVSVSEPESTSASTSSTPLLPSLQRSTGLLTSIVSTTAVDGTTTLHKSLVYGTYVGTDYAQVTHTTSDVYFFPDEATVTFGTEEPEEVEEVTVEYTEPESTTTEQITPEMNELTTPFKETTPNPPTTLKQAQETLAKEEESMEPTTPIPTQASGMDNEIPNEIIPGDHQGRSIPGSPPVKNLFPVDDKGKQHSSSDVEVSSSSNDLPLASTVYKTFTYLTTFYIPDDDGQTTTSVRSREIVSSEVSYHTQVIAPSATLGPDSSTTQASTTPEPEPEQSETTTTPTTTTPTTPKTTTTGTSPITTPKTGTSPATTPITTTTGTSPATTPKEETSPATTPKIEASSEATTEVEDEQITKQDEEFELIFKTLYTTYTYLTTFFQEDTSSVSSREVVETNVITQTVGPFYDVSADVAGLFDKSESTLIVPTKIQDAPLPSTTLPSVDEVTEEEPVEDEDHVATTEDSKVGMTVIDEEMGNTDEANIEPTPPAVIIPQINRDGGVKTYYTTYTYFTTIFVDDETEIETRTEVYTNVVTGGIQPTAALPTTQESQVPTSPETPTTPTTPEPSKPEASEKPPVPPEILAYLEAIQKQKSQEEALQLAKKVQEEASSSENPITESASPSSLQDEEKLISVTSEGPQVTPNLPETPGDGEILGTMVTDVVSTSSSGGGTLVDAEEHRINTFPEDQELSESNNHEVEPAVTLLLQTSYTTFTYFTTMYKSDGSDVVSRLDTVTNVVTETIKPSAVDAQPVAPTSTAPLTEFTTFTYWTTFYKGGDTITTSREKTVSNVVTPGIEPSSTTAVAPIPSREFVVGSTVETETEGDVLNNEVTSPISPVASELPSTTEQIEKTPSDQPAEVPPVVDQPETNDNKSIKPEPTTFYTTFTYFTTSYVGNSTVLNSRLETITSVAAPKDRATGRAIGGGATAVPSIQALDSQDKPSPSRATGLISTIRTSQVTDGITTHFSTDLYGTYIDGLYAQVVESSTRIEKPEEPSASSTRATPVLPTGILSLNRGSIVDADEVSTTYFTTRQVGTIVDGLYAKIVESTSSTKVDEERRATLIQTQTGTHRTGLVRLIEGYIEANETTIFYRSKVIGTSIEGRYAQIIESTSSWLSATPAATIPGGLESSIAPSATEDIVATRAAFPAEIHPSPAVVQSSMSEDPTTIESSMENSTEEPEEDEDEEEGKQGESEEGQKPKKKSRLSFTSRSRTFTPQIRPFASRNRPTFNPKYKGGQGAATITRSDITPTITASLAGKGNRFASSRNRLNSPSGAYSSTTGQLSGSKRFSGRRGSSSLSINPSSGYPAGSTRGRGSARISPSSVYSGARGRSPASIGRGSSVRPGSRFSSSSYPNGVAGSSRFRPGIRASSTLLRGQQPSVRNEEAEDNVNDDTATTLVTEETPYTEDDRYYTDDGDTGETGTVFYQTTTESSRRSTNPLLRFRRPLTLGNSPQSPRLGVTQRTPFATTRRTGNLPKPATSSLNKLPFSGGRTNNRPNVPISTRPRQGQQNSLFPPRGLFNRRPEPTEPTDTTEQTEAPPPNDDEEEEDDVGDDIFDDEEPIEEIVDNDYEGSEQDIAAANRRSGKAVSAPNTIVRIRPFVGRVGRVRRQASQLRSFTANRFRRPGQSNSPQVKAEEKAAEAKPDVEEVSAPVQKSKPGPASRYGNYRSRSHTTQRSNTNSNNKNSNNNNNNNNKEVAESTSAPPTGKARNRAKTRTSGSRNSGSSSRIKPSATSNSGRQFTLREKDTSSSRPSYKRPSSSSTRSRPSSPSKTESYSRPRPPRIRGGGTSRSTQTEAPATSKRFSSESRLRPSSRPSGSSRSSSGRRPSSQRNRPGNGNVRDEPKESYTPPESDGTITVTHYVPTEATIAVINNGVTERKNVLTAQPSTEILGPDRYSTVIGGDGRPLIVIAGDVTGTNEQGLTEVTRFLLHESVTTSITRGPTSIGGRRTTFSHVIPSTVYSVENVVSTRQPATPAANAPLANILLSQLLLGQLGQGNPLLGGLQPQQQPAQQATPTTRYDTRTTSYITTITKHQSTVIPLTFRGKEILTTLVDSTVDVITATEFITDTIVVTPTAMLPGPDINSLLLLLQQPQQPQPQIQQSNLFDPLFAAAPVSVQSNTLPGEVERRYQPVDSDYKSSRDSDSYEDRLSSSSQEEEEEDNRDQNRRQRPNGGRNGSRNPSNQREKQEPVAPVDESTVVTLYVSGRRPGEFSTVLSTVRVGEDATVASRRRRDVDEPSPPVEILATNIPRIHAAPEPAEGILILAGSEEPASAQLPTQSLESVVGDVGRHISGTMLRV